METNLWQLPFTFQVYHERLERSSNVILSMYIVGFCKDPVIPPDHYRHYLGWMCTVHFYHQWPGVELRYDSKLLETKKNKLS
mmetsp:Transcript_18164/g.32411  ORF Transcript_18164/g.32411 Transcript_18164/m.32411 type:complete len:82 (-) Transcript_18164:14-259(-)